MGEPIAVERLISGGQTGVDEAAFGVAGVALERPGLGPVRLAVPCSRPHNAHARE